MYQSYPSGGAEPAAQAPERPSSIRSAVWLMYAGAAVSALPLVWLAGLGAIILLWRRDSGTYIAASKAR